MPANTRQSLRFAALLLLFVVLAWVVTTQPWSPWSHGTLLGAAPANPSAGPAAPPWYCTEDTCDADRVTPELAQKLEQMPGPRRALKLHAATNEALGTLSLVPHLLQLAVVGNGTSLDLTPLAGLLVLHELSIEHAPIVSLEPLRAMRVQKLTLTNVSQLGTLGPVAAMGALEDLSLIGAGLPPLAELAGGGMHRLAVKSTDPVSLQGVDRVPGLRDLVLEECPSIADLPVLERLEGLTELEIGWTSLASPVPLPPHLTSLALVTDKLTDVSFLQGRTSIRRLSLLANDIVDLRPVGSLTELTALNLDGNPRVRDLTPLRTLVHLESLSISRTAVNLLDPLTALPLQNIYVGKTGLASIMPLAKIKTLVSIENLPKNYPQAEVDQLHAVNPKLRISRN